MTAPNATAGRRTIEPREPTSEPLVERTPGGSLAPAGRRLTTTPRTDGLNSYGLNAAEEVVYGFASQRVNGRTEKPSAYLTPEESEAVRKAGPDAAADLDKFITSLRLNNPLPTSFHTLPDGDPSNNYAPAEAAPAAQPTTQPASQPATVTTGTPATEVTPPAAEPPKLVLKDRPAPGEQVEVPPHIASQLPAGTTVVKHENGTELVANIPHTENGRSGFYRVAVAVGHGIEHLAHEVAVFVKKVL